jgi:hypothetical protein
MKIAALIGDIVRSRELDHRPQFQHLLENTLQGINGEAEGLGSPYTITLGDEFQAVYTDSIVLFADIFEILAKIFPVKARFAIGIGELTTALNPRQALGMDGPVFHQARDTIMRMKKGDTLVALAAPTMPIWTLANHSFAYYSRQILKWDQNRLWILSMMLRGEKPVEIIERLEISKVAVYKNIHAGGLDELAPFCQELSRAINLAL